MNWLLAWLLAINMVTAGLYAYDKLASRRRWRRIRERTLKICCLAGGVLGAWLAFLSLHHKTRHRSFWIVQSVASALWAAVVLVAVMR